MYQKLLEPGKGTTQKAEKILGTHTESLIVSVATSQNGRPS
jgi:hypothetical protein